MHTAVNQNFEIKDNFEINYPSLFFAFLFVFFFFVFFVFFVFVFVLFLDKMNKGTHELKSMDNQ